MKIQSDDEGNIPLPDPADALASPGMAEAPDASMAEPGSDWRGWARRLLFCNPFYLCSAALLLLGVNRLSVDPGFLADETQNLFFNFFALQGYGLLLVVTAVVLARRRVWYDSALLVVLDHGLVLVPFMLISQATLLDGHWASLLSAAGGVLVCGRVLAVRRLYPQFNLPAGAAGLGAAILVFNMMLPRIFRPWIEKDVLDWSRPNLWLWLAVLPLIAAGANLLPRPRRYGGLEPERPWLPLLNYALWAIGTGAHLWCLQHICGLPFILAQVAPAACAAAWALRRRLADCLLNITPAWERAVLILPAAASLFALGDPQLLVAVAAANAIAYAAIAWRAPDRVRPLAVELALLSATLAAASVPEPWGRQVLPSFHRANAVGAAGAGYALARALRSARPEVGALGAFTIALIVAFWTRSNSLHLSAQSALVFLLLHSLRWDERAKSGARALRFIASALWVMDALWLTSDRGRVSMGTTTAAATLVLGGWLIRGWARNEWRRWSLPVASVLTMVSGPANWIVQKGSAGVVAMLGSMVLFAAGTVSAWTRHRWDRHRSR